MEFISKEKKRIISFIVVSFLLGSLLGLEIAYSQAPNPSAIPSLLTVPNVNVTGGWYQGATNFTPRFQGNWDIGVTTPWINGTSAFYKGSTEFTDLIDYPELTESWIVFREGSTYYAKNATTGTIDHSGANLVTNVWNSIVGSYRHIHFQNGSYTISSDLEINAVNHLLVTFSNSIIIQSNTAQSFFNITGSCSRIRFVGPLSMWHSAGTTPTAGSCFEIGDGTNSVHLVDIVGMWMGGGGAAQEYIYRGIVVNDNVYSVKVSDVKIDEHVDDAIIVEGGTSAYFTRVTCDNANFPDDGLPHDGVTYPVNGNGDGCSPGFGVHIRKTEGTHITDCDFVRATRGIYLNPVTSSDVNNVFASGSCFDAADQEAARIADDEATTGDLTHVHFVMCWFAGGSEWGVQFSKAHSGVIEYIKFTDCMFLFSYKEGANLNAGPEYVGFIGCDFNGNGQGGGGEYDVNIAGSTEDFYFSECIWESSNNINLGNWCTNFTITGRAYGTITASFPDVGPPDNDHIGYYVRVQARENEELLKTDNSKYELPLEAFYYRVATFGLAYRETISGVEYLVLEGHANAPAGAGDEQNWSIYSIAKSFSYGDFEWYGYETRVGDNSRYRQTYLGLEHKHGRWAQGIATFFRNETGHMLFVTSTGGNVQETFLTGANWTSRTKFKIEWRTGWAAAYMNDTLRANHTTYVPASRMCFFTEVYHSTWLTPINETLVYYDWKSFTYSPP